MAPRGGGGPPFLRGASGRGLGPVFSACIRSCVRRWPGPSRGCDGFAYSFLVSRSVLVSAVSRSRWRRFVRVRDTATAVLN